LQSFHFAIAVTFRRLERAVSYILHQRQRSAELPKPTFHTPTVQVEHDAPFDPHVKHRDLAEEEELGVAGDLKLWLLLSTMCFEAKMSVQSNSTNQREALRSQTPVERSFASIPERKLCLLRSWGCKQSDCSRRVICLPNSTKALSST
jgi:hypothetical protein